MATTLTPSSPASAGISAANSPMRRPQSCLHQEEGSEPIRCKFSVATHTGETSSAASAKAVIYEPQTSTGRSKSQPPFFGHPLREGEGCELNSALFEFEK
jgi:hypothetical protein